jgi:threonine/homoserine/homoserine lactone efflux protein
MTTLLYVLAFLALAYITSLTLGVVFIFTAQLAQDHGRRQDYENKINKP